MTKWSAETWPTFIEINPWTTLGTPIGTLGAGASTVIGSYTGNIPRDSDVFSFQIPAGHQLDSVDLIYDVTNGDSGGGSYMAIQQGLELGTGISTVGNNLSNALVNTSGELLAVFEAGPAFGGLGISAPLASGYYTLGLHESSSADISYSLTFNVSAIPEPSTLGLGLLAFTFFAGPRAFSVRSK